MNQILKEHYESTLAKHGPNHKGMDWPDEKDAEKRYEVMLDFAKINNPWYTLDLGCGSGLLINYLKKNYQYSCSYGYRGIDISPLMIAKAKESWPDFQFEQRDILKTPLPDNSFDYVIMNGVLTAKASNTQEEMWGFAKKMIKAAFKTSKIGIAFNVMSKHVDWERDDLFHVGFDEMATFLRKEVSKNFVFRQDYGLYEYCVYCYKEPQ